MGGIRSQTYFKVVQEIQFPASPLKLKNNSLWFSSSVGTPDVITTHCALNASPRKGKVIYSKSRNGLQRYLKIRSVEVASLPGNDRYNKMNTTIIYFWDIREIKSIQCYNSNQQPVTFAQMVTTLGEFVEWSATNKEDSGKTKQKNTNDLEYRWD